MVCISELVMRIKILVIGSSGQLGSELKVLENHFPSIDFVFWSRKDLDLADLASIKPKLMSEEFDWIINCAAYTKVDFAEQENTLCTTINADAVGIIAEVCKQKTAGLVHYSTDYVFHQAGRLTPYVESDLLSPKGQYAISKMKAEEIISSVMTDYFIIRSSWIYSSFGHNFVKTMLRLAKKKIPIKVVDDQIGSPTYAADLAQWTMKLIAMDNAKSNSGIYHFANQGNCSWFQFAQSIFELKGLEVDLTAIPTSEFNAAAPRPEYSVLDTSKIRTVVSDQIPLWRDSLKNCLSLINLDEL